MSETTTELANIDEPITTFITNDGEQFAFGDATPVLADNLADYTDIFVHSDHDYYIPPISFEGLAKLWRANGHHESAIDFKQKMMMKWLKPHPLISRRSFRFLTVDWQVFTNMYLQKLKNRFGQVTGLKRLPAMNMRKRLDGGYCLLPSKNNRLLGKQDDVINFDIDEVIHVGEADVMQDIYGVPRYLGGIQAVLLSESATLFRRSYYINGNHSGYILVTWDLPAEVNKDIANKIKAGKAPGNFSNYFIGAKTKAGVGQRGESVKDKVQVIPIGDFNQHDDIEKIKKITRDEILAMHRIHPALAAMMPEGNGSFGDIEKISRVNYENEVVPMQQILQEFNDYLPEHLWLEFDQPDFKNDLGGT